VQQVTSELAHCHGEAKQVSRVFTQVIKPPLATARAAECVVRLFVS